jgi:hypothetical protein
MPSDERRLAPRARLTSGEGRLEPRATAAHAGGRSARVARSGAILAGVTIERIQSVVRREVWADALVPTLAIRLAIMAFAVLAVVVFRPDALPADPWLQLWNRWDAPHFLEIAAYGYLPPADPARIVLFPLYPLAIAVGALVMAPIASAMLVSLIAGLAAAAGLHRLVRLDDSRPAARAAVVAMAIFPTAFAFVAPYSESLFVALAIWSFVRAREGDWRSAGIIGALAAFTRIQGVFLLPALAVEYWLARRRLDRDAPWVAVVGLGLVGYLAVNYVAFGDPTYFLQVQRETFHVVNVAPWVMLIDLWGNVWSSKLGESWVTVYVAPLAAFAILTAASVWAAVSRRSRPSYAVYAIVSLVAFTSLAWPISVPRYMLGVFPIFLAMGAALRRPVGPAIAAGSVLLLGMFVTLFAIGHWAF